MRNFRWSSPLGVALITAGGTIGAAIIGGIFVSVVSLLNPEKVVAGPLTPEFLGIGSASLKVPQTLPEDGEGIIRLSISLKEPLDPKEALRSFRN